MYLIECEPFAPFVVAIVFADSPQAWSLESGFPPEPQASFSAELDVPHPDDAVAHGDGSAFSLFALDAVPHPESGAFQEFQLSSAAVAVGGLAHSPERGFGAPPKLNPEVVTRCTSLRRI